MWPPAPGPAAVAGLAEVAGPHALQVASIAEVYGGSGIVDALSQRATFAGALADALAEGYSGIRVAADNTPLVTDEDRLAAWIRWEVVADHFMSENPVIGLCAFDREKVDVDRFIIRGDQAALGEMRASGLLASDHAILQVDGSHRPRPTLPGLGDCPTAPKRRLCTAGPASAIELEPGQRYPLVAGTGHPHHGACPRRPQVRPRGGYLSGAFR
jgi:DcmR-like sensory protein